MPMLWKATGNDWWVSHVVVSLRLFTGTKAVFVCIQAYRFREETISGKNRGSHHSKLSTKVGAKLPEDGDRIDFETFLKSTCPHCTGNLQRDVYL